MSVTSTLECLQYPVNTTYHISINIYQYTKVFQCDMSTFILHQEVKPILYLNFYFVTNLTLYRNFNVIFPKNSQVWVVKECATLSFCMSVCNTL